MRFSIDWHEDAENAAAEERATVGDLRLWLADQNVTLHLDGKASVDHLTISLYGLAEGLVHEWWRIFGARDRAFSLMDHRTGYAVPDIRLSFDGHIFQFEAHQRTYRNPDIRFWAGPIEAVDRTEAEARLDSFIATVIARLDQRRIAGSSAALRWSRVQASRADPDEASFCEAAGALGLDPYQIDDEAAQTIENAAALFSDESLTEFLAGAQGADKRRLLGWIGAVEARPPDRSRIADLHAIATQVAGQAPQRPSEPGWSLGYRRARSMRRVLGLQAGDRFRSYRDLAQRLGASKSFRPAQDVDGIRVLRSDHKDGARLHMRTYGASAEASQLFDFSRAVGDVVCFPDAGRAPVNDLHAAYRQAAGRAFAAEFLAPIGEIRAMQESGRDAVSMAKEFGVSTTLIERQLENRKRIEAACAAA